MENTNKMVVCDSLKKKCPDYCPHSKPHHKNATPKHHCKPMYCNHVKHEVTCK